MGGADRCMVYGCSNDRRYPERVVKKPHIFDLKWHKCPPARMDKWIKLINRDDKKNWKTVIVCSNHFVLGFPVPSHPDPTLFMRGYEDETITKNFSATQSIQNMKSSLVPNGMLTRQGTSVKRTWSERKYRKRLHADAPPSLPIEDSIEIEELPSKTDETIAVLEPEVVIEEQAKCVSVGTQCTPETTSELRTETLIIVQKERLLEEAKNDDKTMKLYTGLSVPVFVYIFSLVRDKVPLLQKYKKNDVGVKRYQIHRTKKPGPKRFLKEDEELLLVLMKLRLGIKDEFLAKMFDISSSLVGSLLSTWIPFLATELQPLIYWPEREQLKLYYPTCFKKYSNVVAIIDCTEVPLQRPSLAKANSQIYSNYKSRPTAKFLIACTPAGTVSFVSKAAGGAMSDKALVKQSGIIDKFLPGDSVLADRGFNIQELLLPRQVKVIIPPFLKKKKQFSMEEDQRTKQVANARIHIERVIGRIKDWAILKHEIPLAMYDQIGHICIIVSALVNLCPTVVPLNSR